MARLTTETSSTYLSVDSTRTTTQKSDADMSLFGAFDEALRQATARKNERNDDPEPEAAEARPAAEPRDTERTDKQKKREADDSVRTKDADKASDGEDRIETDETESDEIPDDAAEEVVNRDEDAEKDDDEVPDVSAVVVQPVVDEAVPVSPEGEAVEAACLAPQNSDAEPVNPEPQTPTPENVAVTPDEAIVDETADGTPQTPAPEGEAVVVESEEATSGDGVPVLEQKPVRQEQPETLVDSDEPAPEAEQIVADTSDVGDQVDDETSREQRGRTSRKQDAVEEGPKYGEATKSKDDKDAAPADAKQQAEGLRTDSVETTRRETPETAPPAPILDAPVTTDHAVANQGGQTTTIADGSQVGAVTATSSASQATASQNPSQDAARGVDPARFVHRVANAFASLSQRGGDSVRLKLYPPELGSLRMEITVKNGELSARVEAETSAAKSVLLDNLPHLRDRLAEQGIKVERFDVGVSDQPQGGMSERPDGGGDRSFQHSPRDGNARRGFSPLEGDGADGRRETRTTNDGRLDVFI